MDKSRPIYVVFREFTADSRIEYEINFEDLIDKANIPDKMRISFMRYFSSVAVFIQSLRINEIYEDLPPMCQYPPLIPEAPYQADDFRTWCYRLLQIEDNITNYFKSRFENGIPLKEIREFRFC